MHDSTAQDNQPLQPQEVPPPSPQPAPASAPQQQRAYQTLQDGSCSLPQDTRAMRTKERMREMRHNFKKNWAIFRQSKLGIIGLGIIMIFVFMAVGYPFFGLRDPMRWMAPESDIIVVKQTYTCDARGGAVHHTPVLQLEAKKVSVCLEKMFVGSDTGIVSAIHPYDEPIKRVVWQYTCDSPIMSEPKLRYANVMLSSDDVLYVTTTNGTVYAINAATLQGYAGGNGGTLAWSYNTGANISGSVGLDPRSEDASLRLDVESSRELYVGNDAGVAMKLIDNGSSVSVAWMSNFTGQQFLTPVVDYFSKDTQLDDVVYFTSKSGRIYALNATTGAQKWNYYVGSTLSAYPAIDFGFDNRTIHRIIIGNATGTVHFIEPYTGSSKLLMPLNLPINHPFYNKPTKKDLSRLTTPSISPDGQELFMGSENGVIYAIRRDVDMQGTGGWNYSLKWNYITRLDPSTVASPHPLPVKEKIAYSKSLIMVPVNGPRMTTNRDGSTAIVQAGEIVGLNNLGNLTWLQVVIYDGSVSTPVVSNFVEQSIGRPQTSKYSLLPQVYVMDSAGVLHAYDSGGEVRTPLPPSWAPGSPKTQEYYILGTDRAGRDIFSQLISGSRIALAVGILSAFCSVMLGTIIGITAGYFGGTVDVLLMRLADVILVLPGLPILIIFSAVMGPSIWNLVIIISLLGWAGSSRIIRSVVLSLKERPFIESARVTGASNARIMFKHIAPNVLPLAFLFMTFAVTGGIIGEAGLSFLGLGDPTVTSWGQMLYDVSRGGQALEAWWWVLPPGLFVTLICLGFFLLGRAFDEVVNPRLRRR